MRTETILQYIELISRRPVVKVAAIQSGENYTLLGGTVVTVYETGKVVCQDSALQAALNNSTVLYTDKD